MTDISIPRERRPFEYRAALTPAGVETLVQAGHRVFVEHDAGAGAGFHDEEYRSAGGQIVYSREEAVARGQIVAKVARPTLDDLALMHEGQILTGFLHLAAGRRDKITLLRQQGVCAIAWETAQQAQGEIPVLHAMSVIAGRMMPQIIGRFMQSNEGGRGVTLGGSATVPPAEVVILGAGSFGVEAALALAGNRASVYLLDQSAQALDRADRVLAGCAVTMAITAHNLRKVVRFADAIVGAVYVPGQRTPILLTREHLRAMRPRSLFVDASIDQGGCAVTSRPTDHGAPVYVEENILHYCVPNISSVAGRTATHALTYATLPYLLALANEGIDAAGEHFPELRQGVNIRGGEIIHAALQAEWQLEGEG